MTPAALGRSQRRFSLAHLVLLVPWVALVIDAWAPIRDNSFLWHIRAGELQANAGEVLVADPFSFTMLGERWLTQSWLAELLYGWGESNWGLGFVPPMMLLLSSVTFLGIGIIAYRRSRSEWSTAIIVALTTLLMISFLVPRPVLFSLALFALVIVAWDRPATRWTIPFLFWIWASVHGSFAIGLAYVGLTIIVESDWKALPTAIVAGLSTFLTAHGLGVLEFLLDFSEAGPALALLSEWRRPELLSVVFAPFLVGVGLIVIGAFRGKVTPKHLILLVPFLLLAFSATRAVPPCLDRPRSSDGHGAGRPRGWGQAAVLDACCRGVRSAGARLAHVRHLRFLDRRRALPGGRRPGAGRCADLSRRQCWRLPDLVWRPGAAGLSSTTELSCTGIACSSTSRCATSSAIGSLSSNAMGSSRCC